MEKPEGSIVLLKNKFKLDEQPEVQAVAARTKERTGQWPKRDPLLRIQNYLNRFHEITDREDSGWREHGVDAFKRLFYGKYIIKPNEILESYFDNQRRLAREQGHGDIQITQEIRDQLTEVIIADQRSSLDNWIDYLSSPDAPYPDALKYFTLRSVISMSDYDKEKQAFNTRSKGTVKPFPDLNREALSYVLDAVEKKYKGQKIDFSSLDKQDSAEFEKLLQRENFAKLYAWAIEKVTPATPEQLSSIQGEWIKYLQGSDHLPLVRSLQGHGTGWCTAGESTAQTQLQDGDFWVYYSLDKDGKPTIPRAAIRMADNSIAEVRGIAPEQNLDSGVTPVVEEALKKFPDGQLYQKKVHDMKLLTNLEHKMKADQILTGQDLRFLYEIDTLIEGFGYGKDPRIKELQSQRNVKEDLLVMFGCLVEEIAETSSEITSRTKIYIGRLDSNIFALLPKQVDQIYTSFPEGRIKIRRETIEIGGKTAKQLEQELDQAGIDLDLNARYMLQSKEFKTFKELRPLDTIWITVKDFSSARQTNDILMSAQYLGLELCPAEAGPRLRLLYKDQPMNKAIYRSRFPNLNGHDIYVAMQPINIPAWPSYDANRGLWFDPHTQKWGNSITELYPQGVFELDCNENGLKLNAEGPYLHSDTELIFCLPTKDIVDESLEQLNTQEKNITLIRPPKRSIFDRIFRR